MVELVVLLTLAFAAVVVFGVLSSVFGMALWLIFLPFRILGWVFNAVVFLLALPFVAIFAVLGLLALMLLTEARRPARQGQDGSLVRLADQDRARWDRALVDEGHALVRACLRRAAPGVYQVQAAIAAVHADAPTAADTDWRQVLALYDQLLGLALRLASRSLDNLESPSAVCIDGASSLLDGVVNASGLPVATLRALVRMVEEKQRLVRLLNEYIDGPGLTIVIGGSLTLYAWRAPILKSATVSFGQSLDPEVPGAGVAHHDHRGGAVVERAGVAGGHLTVGTEDRLQLRQLLGRGAGPRAVVLADDGAGRRGDGRDLAVPVAALLVGHGPLLRQGGELVHGALQVGLGDPGLVAVRLGLVLGIGQVGLGLVALLDGLRVLRGRGRVTPGGDTDGQENERSEDDANPLEDFLDVHRGSLS